MCVDRIYTQLQSAWHQHCMQHSQQSREIMTQLALYPIADAEVRMSGTRPKGPERPQQRQQEPDPVSGESDMPPPYTRGPLMEGKFPVRIYTTGVVVHPQSIYCNQAGQQYVQSQARCQLTDLRLRGKICLLLDSHSPTFYGLVFTSSIGVSVIESPFTVEPLYPIWSPNTCRGPYFRVEKGGVSCLSFQTTYVFNMYMYILCMQYFIFVSAENPHVSGQHHYWNNVLSK